MAYENNEKRNTESIFSKRVRAGKRRTYFFDIKETRGSDYFITITESKKRFNDDGYDRHKVFIYKEDFNKFLNALTETVDYVKTELMPDFDFDAFNHEYPEDETGTATTSTQGEHIKNTENSTESTNNEATTTVDNVEIEDLNNTSVDKW